MRKRPYSTPRTPWDHRLRGAQTGIGGRRARTAYSHSSPHGCLPASRQTTKFRGPGMCLDIFNGGLNDNQPHLVNCAKLSGQLWTLTKTDKRVEGATKID
jgi:hypothetical protein